jgi:hypothetical protein
VLMVLNAKNPNLFNKAQTSEFLSLQVHNARGVQKAFGTRFSLGHLQKYVDITQNYSLMIYDH